MVVMGHTFKCEWNVWMNELDRKRESRANRMALHTKFAFNIYLYVYVCMYGTKYLGEQCYQ